MINFERRIMENSAGLGDHRFALPPTTHFGTTGSLKYDVRVLQ
jgi:hypothetical protein